MDRKKIDVFLIELDLFINKYLEVLTEDNVYDFILPLKMWKPSTFWPKNNIPFLTLHRLINKSNKGKNFALWIRRNNNFLRRVAYKLKYITIKWESYEEIFSRICYEKWNMYFKPDKKTIKLVWFYENNPWKEFIIPEDYWHNYNCYYKWKYSIIK